MLYIHIAQPTIFLFIREIISVLKGIADIDYGTKYVHRQMGKYLHLLQFRYGLDTYMYLYKFTQRLFRQGSQL